MRCLPPSPCRPVVLIRNRPLMKSPNQDFPKTSAELRGISGKPLIFRHLCRATVFSPVLRVTDAPVARHIGRPRVRSRNAYMALLTALRLPQSGRAALASLSRGIALSSCPAADPAPVGTRLHTRDRRGDRVVDYAGAHNAPRQAARHRIRATAAFDPSRRLRPS
jgi:hypothetical protein